MARGEEDSLSESESEDLESEKDWKFLYECEVSKINDYVCTITNLRSEITGLQEENRKTRDELNTTKKALEKAKKEIISLHPCTTMLNNALASGRRAKNN